MTVSPALFPAVTVTVVRDRKIRTALRTNQISGFVTVPSWKKISKDIISSHVRISYRFYQFVITRYTTDFYIIKLLFFSQASERAGFLNPRIWLAYHAHVTGPAFYDTAHGPEFFFPLNAVHKFRSWKLAVIINLLPVLLFHRQKVNASFKLQGKSL